jgi:REP element-mobilizing transposase RayT
MARTARLKFEGGGGWYHVYARAGGTIGEYLLEDKACKRMLVLLLAHFGRAYFCDVAGFCVMGNHYHAVLRFETPREVGREELRRRAELLYPKQKEMLDGWLSDKWERFRRRLFDVSEFMRNVQAAFGRWYNSKFGRRGGFWAERFKSTLLEDEKAAYDCLTYVELNPVRAGLVERPEEFEGSSLFLREIGKDRWLLPLSELTGIKKRKRALASYKGSIYYRGNVPSKPGQASIPKRVVEQEEARGFESTGVFRKRLRYMVDGLAIGSDEFIRDQISRLREAGGYLRRQHPIQHLNGPHLTLREQRTTAR